MHNHFWTRLNEENICVGVSRLASEVPEYNDPSEVDFDPLSEIQSER